MAINSLTQANMTTSKHSCQTPPPHKRESQFSGPVFWDLQVPEAMLNWEYHLSNSTQSLYLIQIIWEIECIKPGSGFY